MSTHDSDNNWILSDDFLQYYAITTELEHNIGYLLKRQSSPINDDSYTPLNLSVNLDNPENLFKKFEIMKHNESFGIPENIWSSKTPKALLLIQHPQSSTEYMYMHQINW